MNSITDRLKNTKYEPVVNSGAPEGKENSLYTIGTHREYSCYAGIRSSSANYTCICTSMANKKIAQ